MYQEHLEKLLRRLFSNQSILVNVRKQTNLQDFTNSQFLELDLWIPNFKLCFEFQDRHHYESMWHSNVPVENIQQRDTEKHCLIHQRGETLVTVPYWWNGMDSSLTASIIFQRPDLVAILRADGNPIPLNPSNTNTTIIPGVGELMLASFMDYSYHIDTLEVE